jgi:hypothetical protein
MTGYGRNAIPAIRRSNKARQYTLHRSKSEIIPVNQGVPVQGMNGVEFIVAAHGSKQGSLLIAREVA